MTDLNHDTIAEMVRCDLTLGLNICAAYLDLHDEVKRLRAELADGSFYKEVDIDRLQERAEKAEAEAARAWKVAHDATARGMAVEAERDALRAALEEIAYGLKGIARNIQIGPDDEGREIYDMVQALQWDARQALKGQTQ